MRPRRSLRPGPMRRVLWPFAVVAATKILFLRAPTTKRPPRVTPKRALFLGLFTARERRLSALSLAPIRAGPSRRPLAPTLRGMHGFLLPVVPPPAPPPASDDESPATPGGPR